MVIILSNNMNLFYMNGVLNNSSHNNYEKVEIAFVIYHIIIFKNMNPLVIECLCVQRSGETLNITDRFFYVNDNMSFRHAFTYDQLSENDLF